MSAAGQFIADLQREQRIGNVSSETEQHLKHEFRKLRWDAPRTMLAAAVGAEIERLERQAATLRKLRETLLGGAQRICQGSDYDMLDTCESVR
jgi:hypothetical protein